MNRQPPEKVMRHLRKEVQFGCPVRDCGRPYLTWHHFDPPWAEENHHNANGMIALCQEHHNKADAGSFTKEQLRELKKNPYRNDPKVQARFDWMRSEPILAIVGGNITSGPTIIQIRNEKCVWFNRDEDGYFLLNIRMPTISRDERLVIRDNFWMVSGKPEDVQCPPSGRRLKVEYASGDAIEVSFRDLPTLAAFEKKFPWASADNLSFPLTTVDITFRVANTPFYATRQKLVIPTDEPGRPGHELRRSQLHGDSAVVVMDHIFGLRLAQAPFVQETFTNQRIVMDGATYEECTFVECTFVLGGFEPLRFISPRFVNCAVATGAAKLTHPATSNLTHPVVQS